MKSIPLAPTEKREWLWLGLRWLFILGLLYAGPMFLVHMPGRSYTGPLPPLSEDEVILRTRLQNHVNTLAQEIGERNLWHYPALQASVNYIRGVFRGLGYVPESLVYESGGHSVENLSVELKGGTLPEEIIVVGAHYDSVIGSPGANDNATGVAALLELARILKQVPVARTLRFVTFVNEEPPFYRTEEMGSLVYANRSHRREERITAMLSLETIGCYKDEAGSQHYPFPFSYFYPDTGNFIGFVGNLASRDLVHQAIDSFRQHTRFPSEGLAAPGWITGVGWSDHWSFWKAGYPAIMITDTALFRYEEYHSYSDLPGKIDFDGTARVVSGMAATIADLANR